MADKKVRFETVDDLVRYVQQDKDLSFPLYSIRRNFVDGTQYYLTTSIHRWTSSIIILGNDLGKQIWEAWPKKAPSWNPKAEPEPMRPRSLPSICALLGHDLSGEIKARRAVIKAERDKNARNSDRGIIRVAIAALKVAIEKHGSDIGIDESMIDFSKVEPLLHNED